MSTDFGEREFALGTIIGERAWKVTQEGILTGVSHEFEWMPGENQASCSGHPKEEQVPRKKEEEPDYTRYYAEVKAWKADHQMIDCGHGFYAYTENQKTDGHYYTSEPVLVGVVEGYGETLIGTKGFRAMKGRIIALSTAPFKGLWDLAPFVVSRLKANYPNVAFFESTLAMRMEFPVTRPVLEDSIIS